MSAEREAARVADGQSVKDGLVWGVLQSVEMTLLYADDADLVDETVEEA